MRIRVIQKPNQECVDGFWLYGFRVGEIYELDSTIGALFVVEGWGEPIINGEARDPRPPAPRPWKQFRSSSHPAHPSSKPKRRS